MSLAARCYVLVHGACHGGWCWKPLAERLRALGHAVFTPTLTGLGERSHLLAVQPTLRLFIEDICRVLTFEDLNDVFLVGHSFGGGVITGVAERLPERLRHLVYLDAMVLPNGCSARDVSPPGHIDNYRARAIEIDGCLVVPPGPPEAYDVTNPEMAAWVSARLTPQPYQTYNDALALRGLPGNGIPATYIACSRPFRPSTGSSRDLAQRMPGWSYIELEAGHNAMMTAVDEMTEVLRELD